MQTKPLRLHSWDLCLLLVRLVRHPDSFFPVGISEIARTFVVLYQQNKRTSCRVRLVYVLYVSMKWRQVLWRIVVNLVASWLRDYIVSYLVFNHYDLELD